MSMGVSLSPNQFEVLQRIGRYFTLTRKQLNRHWFPKVRDSLLRKWLKRLVDLGLVRRNRMQIVNAVNGHSSPVYSPKELGREYLLNQGGDEWARVCTRTPQPQYLLHWCELAEHHIRLDKAIELQSDVRLIRWINEWEEVHPEADTPSERFTLYTQLTEKIVINPDAAFCLDRNGQRKVYIVEIDRMTTGCAKIVATKSPGVVELVKQQHHRTWFPQTNVEEVTVLHFSPTLGRVDRMRAAFWKKPRESTRFWKFVCFEDWTPEKILLEPIAYDTEGDPFCLVRRKS